MDCRLIAGSMAIGLLAATVALAGPQRDIRAPAGQAEVAIPQAPAGHAVAMIIDESRYTSWTPLPNTRSDAEVIKARLQGLGVDVMEQPDLDRASLVRFMTNFRDQAAEADTIVVFFTGHGASDGKSDWLIPIDAPQNLKAADLSLYGISVAQLILNFAGMNKKPQIFVFIDACRNGNGDLSATWAASPLNFYGGDAPDVRFMVQFSSRSGETVSDGTDGHSPFAQALDRHLADAGTESLLAISDDISDDPALKALGIQPPRPLQNLGEGDHYLFPRGQMAGFGGGVGGFGVDADDVNWNTANEVATTDAYRAYRTMNPHGRHLADAQVAIDNLQRASAAPVAGLLTAGSPDAGAVMRAASGDPTPAALAALSDKDVDVKPLDFLTTVLLQKTTPAALEALARTGDARAQLFTGFIYETGIGGVSVDYGAALKWYRAAADQDLARADNALGRMYFFGQGVAKDEAAADGWFVKGTADGGCIAMGNVGVDAALGEGRAQDLNLAVSYYQKAGDCGYTTALVNLGGLYYSGKLGTRDYASAVKAFRQAADAGDPLGVAWIGFFYEYGLGMPVDMTQALVWYQKAADLGEQWTQVHYGDLYAAGNGVQQDYDKAFAIYKKWADAGNAYAQERLAHAYLTGQGAAMDPAQAVVYYRKAANQGMVLAEYDLGYLYYMGNLVPEDDRAAFDLMSKAAASDEDNSYRAGAMYWLGVMYYDGKGVTQDFAQAAQWLQKASDLNLSWAMAKLGYMYELGQGVPKSADKAVALYEKAAAQGYSWGQNNLARMYWYGDGVAEDDARAFALFQKAADQGLDVAQYHLAEMYLEGAAVREDDAQAFAWAKKAADQGLADAQSLVASLYLAGKGTPINYGQALLYAQKAVDQGDADAKALLGVIYINGMGVPANTSEGINLIRQSADAGSTEAEILLAYAYHYGEVVPADEGTSKMWLDRAITAGDDRAKQIKEHGWSGVFSMAGFIVLQ